MKKQFNTFSFSSKIICIILSITMCIALTACNKNNDISVENPNIDGDEVFHSGIWVASVQDKVIEYYFFYDDGKSGKISDVETGSDREFIFTTDSKKKSIHFDFSDSKRENNASYEVKTQKNGDDYQSTVTLKWSNDEAHTVLKFVDDADTEFNSFYSNQQLEIMAGNCYIDRNKNAKSMPSNFEITSNEDSTVEIKFFDDMGDENSAVAWYEVNRFTGEGKDMMTEEEIDFNHYYVINQ